MSIEISSMSVIRQALNNMEGEFILLEPATYDAAIVGLVSKFGSTDPVVCYDTKKIIEILQSDDGMGEDDAWEFYYFNIEGAYVGEATPVFINTTKSILAGDGSLSD